MTDTNARKRLKRNDAQECTSEPNQNTQSAQHQDMNKKLGNAGDFYGILADQCLNPTKSSQAKLNEKFGQPHTSTIADLNRVQVRTNYQNTNKKRNYNEITTSNSKERKGSTTLKKQKKLNASDDENASIHKDSYNSEDENEGGSSQNEYEADFIDDGMDEQKAARKKQIEKKGQLSSADEEEFLKTETPARDSAPEDQEDPYDELPVGDKESGFRFNKETNEYHLKNWFCLSANQYNSLFQHQRVGVSWLYDLFQKKMGGVLGDDMGLGKTVQVATLCKGLFDSEQIKKVLIVVPATMKSYWQAELQKWCSDVDNIMQFDDKRRQDRELQIKTLKKHGGILVTSYGMVTSERMNLSDIRFDIVCVDEGHRAKNINTDLRKNLVNLRVKGIRLSLSGTPIQNNLSELWSVFDFVQPKIFGSYSNFQQKFAEPIENGLLKGASRSDQQNSDLLSSKLREMYKNHFLRRTKDNIFTIRCAETLDRPLKMTELPLKTDLVIWLPLTSAQKKIYSYLIQNQEMLSLVQNNETKAAFFVLSYIKKLCLHPQLLAATSIEKKKNLGLLSSEEEAVLKLKIEQEQAQQVEYVMKTRRSNKVVNQKQVKMCKELEKDYTPVKDLAIDEEAEADWSHPTKKAKFQQAATKKQQQADSSSKSNMRSLFEKFKLGELLAEIEAADQQSQFDKTIAYSSKITFLMTLMKNLRQEGHRVLIFSMSKKILNILEAIIKSGYLGKLNGEHMKYMRIDGDTEIITREQICNDFNKDPSIFCGLLTTKVGGFGLNLTGADRAIILDPDWNPANDNQAVDRVFRIGQKRDVIVYRLLTMCTIEEKVYRRQIYKKGMSLATIDNGGSSQNDFDKYFSTQDLFELFQFDPDAQKSDTLDMLLKRDGFPIVSTPTNDKHVAYLRTVDLVKGISLNSNLYNNNDNEKELLVQEPEVFVPIASKKSVQAPIVTQQYKQRLQRFDQLEKKTPSTNEEKITPIEQTRQTKSFGQFRYASPLKPAQDQNQMPVTNLVLPQAQSRPYQPLISRPISTEDARRNEIELLFGTNPFTSLASQTKQEAESKMGFTSDELFKQYAFVKK